MQALRNLIEIYGDPQTASTVEDRYNTVRILPYDISEAEMRREVARSGATHFWNGTYNENGNKTGSYCLLTEK